MVQLCDLGLLQGAEEAAVFLSHFQAFGCLSQFNRETQISWCALQSSSSTDEQKPLPRSLKGKTDTTVFNLCYSWEKLTALERSNPAKDTRAEAPQLRRAVRHPGPHRILCHFQVCTLDCVIWAFVGPITYYKQFSLSLSESLSKLATWHILFS